MLGVLLNSAAIVLGSLIGILFSKKLSKKIEDVITLGSGIVTIVLGLQMALKYESVVYFSLALILGGITGTALDLDGKFLLLGKMVERIFYRKKENENNLLTSPSGEKDRFARAFLNASVIFCVGAMGIIGSIKAGIDKDPSILFTKSILDGFLSVSFAAAMGIGTAFSAFIIFIYEGLLTLLSTFLQPFCTEQMINELTGCGGAMVVMIGINLAGIKEIKSANFLPGILFTVIFVLLDPLIKGCFNF